MFALVTGVLLVQAPTQPSERQPDAVPLAVPTVSASEPVAPEPVALEPPAPSRPPASGGFFGADTTTGTTAPPGPAAAPPMPPMPPIEELPPRPGAPAKEPKIVLGGAKDRKPVAGGGAGFFDPGKLSDASTGGGSIQIRGYLGFNFAVTERTNVAMRNEGGTCRRRPVARLTVHESTGASGVEGVTWAAVRVAVMVFSGQASGVRGVSGGAGRSDAASAGR